VLTGNAGLGIMLGAGASLAANLPDWNGFAARVAVSSGLVVDEAAADILVKHQDLPIILEAAREQALCRVPLG